MMQTFLPRWTQRVVISGSGRDPLALSRVSDVFTNRLLPSIITTTERARYYSFYAWAVREARLSAEAGEMEFEQAFRVREAAFAIASKEGRETKLSIVGIDEVERCLSELDDDDVVDTSFPVLPSSPMGGLGQYYIGCLNGRQLGIVDELEDKMLGCLEGRGVALAEAFGASIRSSPVAQLRGRDWLKIPLSVLAESSDVFSLDGIRAPEAAEEREILTRMFLELDDSEHQEPGRHRQAAIGQLLHVLEAYALHGEVCSKREVEESCLFWPHYYRQLDLEEVEKYSAFGAFTADSEYWRQFCAHQFFTFGAELFLSAILDALSDDREGLTKEELIQRLLKSGFVDDMEKCAGVTLDSPAALVRFFGPDYETQEGAAASRMKFSGEHDLAEWWSYRGGYEECPATRLGRVFVIWAQLYAKWRWSEEPAIEEVLASANREWSIGTCFDWGDRWMKDELGWEAALGDLVDSFYSRHEEIRFQKRKLEACWIEMIKGRYTKLQDLNASFRASRHRNMVSVLQDLGILQDGGLDDDLVVTDRGRAVLNEVKEVRK